jgi:hypothetical protein
MREMLLIVGTLATVSCATTTKQVPAPSPLVGFLSDRLCPTSEYQSDAVPTVTLDAPIDVAGLGSVDSVELIFAERELVQYGSFVNRRVSVSCNDVSVSHLCGPNVARATCGVTEIASAP